MKTENPTHFADGTAVPTVDFDYTEADPFERMHRLDREQYRHAIFQAVSAVLRFATDDAKNLADVGRNVRTLKHLMEPGETLEGLAVDLGMTRQGATKRVRKMDAKVRKVIAASR